MGRAPLGFPSSFAPRRYRRRTSRAGPGHRSTDLELRDHIRLILQSGSSLVSCDRRRTVQLGRGSRAGPGACSVTRAAAQGCLLAGTSQAIGKRLCGHIVRTSVTPEFMPKRNSELSGNRGLRPASAASLEIGDEQGADEGRGRHLPSCSHVYSPLMTPGALPMSGSNNVGHKRTPNWSPLDDKCGSREGRRSVVGAGSSWIADAREGSSWVLIDRGSRSGPRFGWQSRGGDARPRRVSSLIAGLDLPVTDQRVGSSCVGDACMRDCFSTSSRISVAWRSSRAAFTAFAGSVEFL